MRLLQKLFQKKSKFDYCHTTFYQDANLLQTNFIEFNSPHSKDFHSCATRFKNEIEIAVSSGSNKEQNDDFSVTFSFFSKILYICKLPTKTII